MERFKNCCIKERKWAFTIGIIVISLVVIGLYGKGLYDEYAPPTAVEREQWSKVRPLFEAERENNFVWLAVGAFQKNDIELLRKYTDGLRKEKEQFIYMNIYELQEPTRITRLVQYDIEKGYLDIENYEAMIKKMQGENVAFFGGRWHESLMKIDKDTKKINRFLDRYLPD